MEWNWILEEYDDMVYVSDLNNYELLYVNRVGLDMFHLSREELFSGKKHLCYEIFHGRNTPCPFCTNKYLKDSGFYEWEHYNEQLGKTYLLKDRKVLWDGRESRIEFVFKLFIPLKMLSFATRRMPVRKPKARCGLSFRPPEKKLRMKFTISG